ncbi:MAG: ATP-binding protein [Bacteroidales bacterium]
MKIKYKLLIYIIALHILLLALSIPLMKYSKYWIIAAEGVILVSVILALRIYWLLKRPFEFSFIGAETLKNKDFSNKFVLTGNYEIDLLIEVYNKMIDQLREERIITEEKNFFLDKLIESSPVGIIMLDFDEKIASLNPAALNFLTIKPETLIGKTLQEAGNEFLLFLNQCETDQDFTFSINGIKKYKCYKSHFINKGFRRHFIIFEELTNEILEAEKNAYGKVIRMMSHEVNNTVGSINSLLDTLKIYKNGMPQNQQTSYEEAIKIAMERNQNLGIFMSNFANVIRLPKPSLADQDLIPVIKKVVFLMQSQKPEKQVNISVSGTDDKFVLKIDPVQMEQALMNILKNAVESIPGSGKIEIHLSKKEKKLTIRDNGQGITEENSKKLFTPFFSTKPHGQGIGLTLVRDILLNHGFTFSLSTKPEGFTEFEIWFSQD